MELEDYQKRVIEEKNQLLERITKLESFIQSNKWSEVHERDQNLLKQQYKLMEYYYHILNERIGRFIR